MMRDLANQTLTKEKQSLFVSEFYNYGKETSFQNACKNLNSEAFTFV